MYKIALYTSFNCHLECVGFICELFTNNKYLNVPASIDLFYNEDPFNNIEHYKDIYTNLNNIENYSLIFHKITDYDLIIKLSSNDTILNHPNIISILHRIDLTDNIDTYITLSPLVNYKIEDTFSYKIEDTFNYKIVVNYKINYIFPLYNPVTTKEYENIITYIGYFDHSHYDTDLQNFINSSPNYHFYFLFNQNINPFSMKNVTVIYSCKTNELVNIVKKSKFILIRKLPHQSKQLFSGALSIALSFKKPIILQNYFAKIYGLDLMNIGFETYYSELIDLINNFPDTIYQKYLQKMEENYNTIIDYNKKKFTNLINR
jgi:hypothetical protein